MDVATREHPQESEAVEETPKTPGRKIVDGLAEAPEDAEITVDTQQADDATDWFLSDDDEEVTDSFQLNVGTGIDSNGKPKEHWITWTVRAIDRERISAIRKQSREKRRRGPGGEGQEDDMAANLRIAAEGTVVPDLTDPMVRGQFADPASALQARFRHKSGLIDQIAGRVVTISGYDDDDVREVIAAKNS